MTRAIVENKKIVGYEKIVEPFNKPTAEEYERRQKSVALAYKMEHYDDTEKAE